MSDNKSVLVLAEGYAKELNQVELTDITCIDKLDTIFQEFIKKAIKDYGLEYDSVLANVLAMRLSALYYEIKNTK